MDIDGIRSVLLAYGVSLEDSGELLSLAQIVYDSGVSIDNLQEMCKWVKKRSRDKPGMEDPWIRKMIRNGKFITFSANSDERKKTIQKQIDMGYRLHDDSPGADPRSKEVQAAQRERSLRLKAAGVPWLQSYPEQSHCSNSTSPSSADR